MNIKVLIVDDHVLIREGLRRILSLEPSIALVGEAENGKQAIEVVTEKNVDVVLLDINMPEMNGIKACQLIKKNSPKTQVIALTIHEEEDYLFEMIRSGASAFLLKDVSSDRLIKTIKGTARGESFIPPKLMSRLFLGINRLASTTGDKNNGLTQRELEVLQLVAQGQNNKAIAKKLYISEKTVKNHLTSIFQKLGVTDRTQAALYAIKNKIVEA